MSRTISESSISLTSKTQRRYSSSFAFEIITSRLRLFYLAFVSIHLSSTLPPSGLVPTFYFLCFPVAFSSSFSLLLPARLPLSLSFSVRLLSFFLARSLSHPSLSLSSSPYDVQKSTESGAGKWGSYSDTRRLKDGRRHGKTRIHTKQQ